MSNSAFQPTITEVTNNVPTNVPIVTASEPITITFTSGGTISGQKVNQARVGDKLFLEGSVNFSGAGSGSIFQINMPTGLNIDTSKIDSATGSYGNHIGTAGWWDNGVGSKQLMPWVNSSTRISFAIHGSFSNLLGSDLAVNDSIAFAIFVPIAEWAGSGTTTLATRAVEEYAWNSSTSTTSDTTSFGNGPQGVLITSMAPTGVNTVEKRVRFQNSILPTDTVFMEINNGSGWASASDVFGTYRVTSGTAYGQVVRQVSGSSTDFSVFFASQSSGESTWATLQSSNWRWRLRKISSGAQIGYPVSARNIIGDTSGSVVPVGMLGERLSSSPASTVSFGANAASTQVASITLTPGTWAVSGMVRMNISGTVVAYFAGISNSASSIDSASFLSGASATVTGATYVSTPIRYVTINQNTPYYLIGTINFSSAPTGGYGVDSLIQAVRIA